MPMIIDFADGFTSSPPPSLETIGAQQENFTLLNNQASYTNFTGLIIDGLTIKTTFFSYEIERIHTIAGPTIQTYRESGEFTAIFDGTVWKLERGNYSVPSGQSSLWKDDNIIVNPSDVAITIDVSTGQMSYKSGNMTGTGYEGNFKAFITRIIS